MKVCIQTERRCGRCAHLETRRCAGGHRADSELSSGLGRDDHLRHRCLDQGFDFIDGHCPQALHISCSLNNTGPEAEHVVGRAPGDLYPTRQTFDVTCDGRAPRLCQGFSARELGIDRRDDFRRGGAADVDEIRRIENDRLNHLVLEHDGERHAI